MLLSKLHVVAAVGAAGLLALFLAREVREHLRLRQDAASQSAAAGARRASLEKQVAAATQRVSASEANVATLLQAAKVASATRRAASPAPARVDAAEAVKAVMERAKQSIAEGKNAEALDDYVKCYRELQAIRPGSRECQSLMSAIQRLGRTYPEALIALGRLRDAAMAQREAQPAREGLVSEIALLNERLGQGDRTLKLYDTLPENDPGRQTLARIASTSFLAARRYPDVLLGIPFGSMLSTIETGAQQLERQDASLQAQIRDAIVARTLTNIEVLTGAGKADEARLLTEKLRTFDDTPATRAALAFHLERARSGRQ